MQPNLNDFVQQLQKVREQSKNQQGAAYYVKKMNDAEAKLADHVLEVIRPLIEILVDTEKDLRLQSQTSQAYVYHIVYAKAKHCRISVRVASDEQVSINAIIGGSFNLQHMSVYSGPLDDSEIVDAVASFLTRCYRFLLTGQL